MIADGGGILGGIAALAGGAIIIWVLMNLLGALIVGAVARFLLPGKDKVGWPTTIAVGFLGGMLAGIVGKVMHRDFGFLGSILGAMVLLAAHRVWSMSKAKGGNGRTSM